MNWRTDGEDARFAGVAARLGRADFSGESRVKDVLKRSLLDRSERRGRRGPLAWVLPAAAVFAAAFLMINVLREPAPAPGPAAGAAYNLVSDGYGDCGRRGLADYTEEERY